MMFIQL